MKKNSATANRIRRIVKHSVNAEQLALDYIREIGYAEAIFQNPKDVLKLLNQCCKTEDSFIGIWDLQFMFEDNLLPIPDKYYDSYATAIKELSKRTMFIPYVDESNIDDVSEFF